MADVTNLFKATVKTLKSREKSISEGKDGSKNQYSIFPAQKIKGEFENKAKELVKNITILRDFLLKYRKDYLGVGCHLIGDASQMTEAERDRIDIDAQDTIRRCNELLATIKEGAASHKVHQQVKDHRGAVIKLVEDYLKVVCKIYSEQRAVRVKRVVDRKRISKLEPERKLVRKKMHLETNDKKLTPEGEGVNKLQNKNNSRQIALDESHDYDHDSDSDISPEEAQLFQQENEALYDEFNSLAREVSRIEGQVVEISRLQEIFAEKVLEQDHVIDRISDATVTSTENIKDGNEEVRQAMKNSAGFRVWILFFVVVCTLSLLFLDWYND